jgi:hypothetical protein
MDVEGDASCVFGTRPPSDRRRRTEFIPFQPFLAVRASAKPNFQACRPKRVRALNENGMNSVLRTSGTHKGTKSVARQLVAGARCDKIRHHRRPTAGRRARCRWTLKVMHLVPSAPGHEWPGHPAKSRVVDADGLAVFSLTCLGFVFRGRRAGIKVSGSNVRKFKRRIREITGRSRGISMEHRLSRLRSYLRGWAGYFGLASQLKLFDKLDQWIRRRIRMCYWKQWRNPKTRRRELIRLGVPRRQAIRHARSRKGYWHMAKTIASGVGLTNQWLEDQGLIRLKQLWSELAPLR